ncbi:hypothetical protein ACPCKW_30240 [Streptomyces griseoincarnatus]
MSMIRRHFHDLPVEARQAIADKTGSVHAARTAGGGLNSGIAAFLDTDQGPVFVKGIATTALPTSVVSTYHRRAGVCTSQGPRPDSAAVSDRCTPLVRS